MTTPTPTPPGPMVVTRDVRRANWWLLAGMAVFAVTLCVTVFLWMYGRMTRMQTAEREGRAAAAAELAQRPPTEAASPANPSPSPVAPR